jgi:hypothetical protein
LSAQFEALPGRDALTARVLSLLADKELTLSSQDVERLLRMVTGDLSREERRGSRRRREQREADEGDRRDGKRRRTPGAAEMRARVERSEERPGLLSLFNHRRGGHDNWIVVPFVPNDGGPQAVLRLRIGEDDHVNRYTLSLYGDPTWHFAVKSAGKTHRLVVYCSDMQVRNQSGRLTDGLRKKLHNLAFEIDDTIRETAAFDPFVSETSTDVGGIDTRV